MKITATLDKDSGYTTHIDFGNNKHELVSDEPEHLGGSDLGPNPYALLCASLASCTAITIKMYAQRKKWPLEDIWVEIEHSKVEAPEELKEAAQNRKIDHFHRKLRFTGDLDEKQTERLMDIADKCPVHKSLHLPVITTSEQLP